MAQSRKPVFILTGFLGAGKTTLLNHMLRQDAWADTLVIVNEFGEIALDHHLIENSSDTILELSNGCVCCSVRGELVDTLLMLDTTRFEQVVIETTGLADPLPILQSLMAEQHLADVYRPSGIITVVDALTGMEGIEKYPEAKKQVALGDVIVVTKQDLSEEGNAFRDNLYPLNHWAQVIDERDDLTPTIIEQSFSMDKVLPSSVDSHHAQHYQSIVLESDDAMSIQTIHGLMRHLSTALGDDLLRLKGLVKSVETSEKPLLVQISGGYVHEFEQLEKWPKGFKTTQLVVITKTGDAQLVSTIFNAFTGNVEIDSPDKQALTNNPLSILGM